MDSEITIKAEEEDMFETIFVESELSLDLKEEIEEKGCIVEVKLQPEYENSEIIVKESLQKESRSIPKSKIACPYCSTNVFVAKDHFLAHIQKYHASKMVITQRMTKFRCNMCSKLFTSISSLCTHIAKHKMIAKGEKVIHKCEKCNFSTVSLQGLKSHEQYHRNHEQEQRKMEATELNSNFITCVFCKVKTFSESNYRNHLWVRHSRSAFKCELCKEYFRTCSSLSAHSCKNGIEKSTKK